jgi:hypothetical protein
MAAAATEAATPDARDSESSSGEANTARRAGQWPPQAPPKADCLLTGAEAAGRAKQNRPGAPQATAPDAVPAPPPPPPPPPGGPPGGGGGGGGLELRPGRWLAGARAWFASLCLLPQRP